jgi:hypothetical protein
MIYCCESVASSIQPTQQTNHPITLFCQFFVHSSPVRNAELQYCLRKNVENQYIDKIVMLNERIYSGEELGIESSKIVQIEFGKRLLYESVFHYVNDTAYNIQGYYIITNTDIFFDDTIHQLRYSDTHSVRKMWSLLRWEYSLDLEPTIYGPNSDSQDTWIFHTNNCVQPQAEKIFRFSMGVPGCDNKMIYAAHICGFEVVNDPKAVRTYHYHMSNERNYSQANRLPRPYGAVCPVGYNPYSLISCSKKDGYSFYDNQKLMEYIQKKNGQKRKYLIPRIHPIAANLMFLYNSFQTAINENKYAPETFKQMEEKLQNQIALLKHYDGVKLANMESVNMFCVDYMMSYEKCELYCGWSKYDVAMNTTFAEAMIESVCAPKPTIWGGCMDIFHYIWSTPWTHALRGKRILIICEHSEIVKSQLDSRTEIFGVDLFPECAFQVLPSPAKYENSPSKDFQIEIKSTLKQLDKMMKTFDVALIAGGGYSSYFANYIYDCGKSAIMVGDVLLMYFGIFDDRLIKERGDIFRIYLNSKWKNRKIMEPDRSHFPVW